MLTTTKKLQNGMICNTSDRYSSFEQHDDVNFQIKVISIIVLEKCFFLNADKNISSSIVGFSSNNVPWLEKNVIIWSLGQFCAHAG